MSSRSRQLSHDFKTRGTPHNGLYGEAPAERRTFFRPRDESVGILLVEVNEKVGKSVIWVCERAQKG